MAELLRFQKPMITGEVKVSYDQLLNDALKAREKFLGEHPDLRAYQDEIDRLLQKVAGPEDRMAVIGIMLQAKVNQLKDAFAELYPVVSKLGSLLETGRENVNGQEKHEVLR